MSFDDQVDLGIKDNSGEKDDGFEKFLSKPIQRQYQPFGGPKPQTQSSIAQPQYAPQEPQPQPQPQPYHNFNDYDLDGYEQAKKQHSQISQFTRENKKSASHYSGLYDDFKKNEFTPYFESIGGFGDFETDDEYISAIDEMYKSDLKNSQAEDGWFGASDSKLSSAENLKKYGTWNQPNGLRDKFQRLKRERDTRKSVADQAEAQEFALFEQMTSIPIAQREALDASLKARTAKPKSRKATDEMLNQMQFEDPVVDMVTGEVTNLEKTDPRNSPPSAVNMVTGERTPAVGKQAKRLEAAMRGDMAGFMTRRESIAKDRQIRDKGFMFSSGGQIDGRPIGMSRKDTDLLDLEEMQKAGMTEYKGQPIEQALEQLGGGERLKVAKVMQSVYAAKSTYEDAQLEFLKVSGGAKGEAARDKMEAAREEVNKTIGLAAQHGLDNELFEQAETTGWLAAIGNSVKRGLLMSEMSNYTPDFLTNTLDADEMQRFIEIASEIEELPTSSTMKRVKSTKSDGPLDAIGNLLFDNPAAIPEMFVESLSSFLPSAIKWVIPSAATGALAGSILPGAGTAAGATLGARASWGVASFVLEASGMALEGMQELGIDWKNPKVFAAAWTNESIRSKIQKKMVQKGTPIAVADMLTGMMAGKVMAVANHTGNAMFKGGKLLNKSQFNKTAGSVPRFTTFQKTRNAGAELGFDSMMGMSGEYLGQWASKEPGEDWDWDAIAAEGIVGVGPGVISSALEMRGPQANYFSNAPIEITGEEVTETGSMGTVTRAGYSAPYQTFNDAESMMGHFGTYKGVTEESLAFTQEWVSRMYAVNPEGMSKLKIALSPRTPDANLENRGTFEAREGQEIMYINEQEFAADPMGTVMHESGHFARISIFPKDEDLMNAWNVLSPDDKLEAYSQYFTKQPEVSFESLDDKTKKKIQRSFNRTPDDVLAEEWFSYQWGRVLMGLTADKSLKAPLKNFKNKLVHPILSQYLGTENLGGEKNEQGYILDQKILSFLEGKGMPTPKNTEKSGNPSNATPQTKDQAQTKLNAMPGTPQEKSNIARALNAMLGAQVLTESPSFYTNLNRQAVIGASKDVEDREKKKAKEDAETVEDTLKESNLKRLEKKIAKRKKTDGYAAKDQPQDISSPEELSEQQLREDGGFQPKAKPEEISESPGGKQLPEGLGTIPREPQKSDGLFPTKPNARAAQQRIKKAAQKEAQKAELIKKREAIKKAKRDKVIEKSEFLKKQKAAAAKRKELTAFREPKDPIKVRKNRAYDEDVKIKPGKEVSLSKNRYPGKSALVKNKEDAKLPPISTTREQEEMLRLDKMLPKTVEEREAILELNKLLNENKETLKTIDSVDEAIDDAIKDIGPQASITEIIVKVLKLEEMLKLSPVSIVSEIERAMNPTASRSKLPSSNDIEDMATEARERIEDTKERLNLRIAEIDREIISLEKGLLPQPAAGSTTIDSANRKRDAERLAKLQPLLVEQGSPNLKLYDHKGNLVATGYDRVVYGDHGPYIEFSKSQLEMSSFPKNKVKKKSDKAYYDEAYTEGGAKLYIQKKGVSNLPNPPAGKYSVKNNRPEGYADYKPGKFYISPDDLRHDVVWAQPLSYRANPPQPAAQGQGPKEKAESPNQGIKAEIAELKSAKKLAKAFLNFVSPEEASVDWKDVPHNLLWYRLRTGGKLGEAKRLTFGMMAEYKSFADRNIEISTSKKNADKDIFRDAPNRTPQEELWDYATSEFDPKKGRQDDMDTPKEFYGGLSKNEYILILEAIKASAMLPKQQDIATKPMGTARWTGTGTDKKEASRGYPGGGYTVLKGANYGAIIAERIRQIQATGKKTDLKIDKSDTNFEYVENGKLYPQFSLETLEPTIPEVIALIMANGRTLELLGDPSDSMKDFDRALFTIAREEMKSKLLGEKKNDDGGIPSDIENQFEYAEEDGAPYTQVEPAATLAKTLSKILSIKARLKFENEYREYIVENIQADLKNYELSENPKTKTVEGIRGGSLNTSGKTPLAALLELEDYIQGINKNGGVYIKSEAEEKADATSKGRLVPIPKSVIKSLNGLMAQLNTRKDNEAYLKKKLEGHSSKIIPGVSNPSPRAVASFKTKPESEYSFRKPLDQSSDKIPAKEDHGEFSAGKIFETFDVMTAYARGKEIYEGTFQKERTSIANSETMPARPLDETVEADLLSSTDVSAVDLANWYLRNSDPVKQMADLQMLPSSKSGETRVQLPGGLGEGLLPYVFTDFITELYKKFGIKDLDARIKEAQWEQASEPAKGAKTKIPFRWNFEKGLFRIDGKLADPKLFTDEENRLHPEVMEALTRPIVQAVLDAEGIDVYGQFNPASENLLQRDTTKGQSFDEDNQTLDANDDSVETGSFEDPADGETSGVLKNQGAVIERKDEEGRAELRNQILEELEQNPELVERIPADLLSELITEDMGSISEILKKEFDRTFTPGGPDRSLNSDAGKQEMPMSPLNVYRSADADFGFEEDFRLETTVGQELKKLGIKVDKNGVPYTDNKVAIKKGFPMILYRGVKYNPKTKTTGRPAEGVFFTREFETAEAYANGYKMSGNYEADMKAMDSYRDELKANGEKLIVFSYLYQSPGNSMTKKAGIAPKQKELTVGTMEGQKDYNAMLEFGEYTFGSGTGERSYVLKTSQLSGKDGLLAAHEIDANSSVNEEGSTPKLIPFNEIPQNGLNPRELDKFERKDTERNLRNRSLNSDATLTSDVNPNLAKANLLSRIAGDSELKKNFEEWLKDKKDSELAGSFMMSFVDQADPVKRIHKSLFDTLKEAGLDIAKGPMRSLYNKLNTHGKWHQYFGKGYDTVEQARIQFIQPIKDAMLKYGIDQTTFGKYLLARAAPSRNQHLRDKVKRLQKEAEGLTGVPKQTALTDIQKVYLNKDGTVKDSGISDQAAYNLITEYENNPKTGANFVNFLNEALDPYYNMNKESITMLRNASMIRESTQLDGVQEGLSEYDRMVGAMSRIDLADSKPDFNFAGSKVKLSDPKYSYSPMQGFEGETEAFFDAERAWEELGKGQNSSGKGWDQPKSELLRDPAFGRVKGTRGPNPDSVLANAINQFFDSAIRSHKNEVSQSFGEMFQLMRAIAYPDREEPYAPNDPELRIAYGQMSKLPEEQKKKIKEEFDEIFEQDFSKTQKKNTLTFSDEYVTDGNTGEFVAKRKTLNAVFKQDPLVFVYRVNGTPEFIKFKSTTKGTRMARSMKNLKYESLPSVLKYFNKITRFMAQMFTSMNPAFIIPNFFRDLGTAFIHLTEDDKKVLIKDVFKMKNLKWITSIGKAELLISQGKDPMKGRIRTEKLKGQTEDEYAQAILKRGDKIEMYAYAKRNGAKIGYVRHDTVPELIRNIKKETGKSEGATKRRLKYALSYVDAANTGVENSVRMSTFWAAIKNGYTPQESATMSRNITVDFNQKGELTQAFGSLYVFFGAAVNSTHRFMTTLNRRSPAEQAALIGGIATASFVVAMFNRMLDDDEDEAVPDYDTISSYKRDSNLIIPLPAGLPEFFNDKKDTGYFSIPLPLGYNLFWGMGQVIADVAANNWGEVRGGSGVLEGSRRLLESSMNAFNPIGGASIATIGTPTFVTPIIELWANKNFMGRQIRYGDDKFSGMEAPGHMQDPKSTPAHWNALSKGINEFFGGDDVVKGSLAGALGNQSPLMYDQDSDIKFDISGNQFKHLAYGYLGGPGQLLDTAFGGLFSAAQGKASIDNVGQVPIVNRFLRGTTYGSHTRDLYYSLRTTVKTAEKAVKDAKNINSRTYGLVNNQLRPMLSMSGQVRTFEAQKNKFRRLKAKVESASNLTEAQKMQRVADIEEKELNMMVKVIKKAQSLGIS